MDYGLQATTSVVARATYMYKLLSLHRSRRFNMNGGTRRDSRWARQKLAEDGDDLNGARGSWSRKPTRTGRAVLALRVVSFRTKETESEWYDKIAAHDADSCTCVPLPPRP
jgi:hypothetical protein